jgi:uridine kinase
MDFSGLGDVFSSMEQRLSLLHQVASLLPERPNARISRIAIDGVDGAGKTVFADELAAVLTAQGKPVIRASVDGFHHPRAVRYQRGRDSAEGFFRDSYDYAALRRWLLDPLSAGGSGRYRRAVFDVSADAPVSLPEEMAPPGACLVFDGIFLHRPELQAYWDFSVFLDVDFAVSIPRGAQRGPGFGSPDPEAASNRRYIEGQKLYFAESQPQKHATLVIDNTDLAAPQIVRRVPFD